MQFEILAEHKTKHLDSYAPPKKITKLINNHF